MTNKKIALTTGITSKTSQNWTNFVAQEKGFFEKEGLNHDYVTMGDMREGMDQLSHGKVPIVTAMADTPILEIERGANIRIIASIARTGFGHIVATPECINIKQLKGRSVAVIDPRSGSTVILREILRKEGLEESDYNVKHLGGTPKRYEALKRGEVAAAFLSPPYDFQAEAEGYILLADYAEHFPSYPLAINVNMDFALSKPHVVIRYLKAMILASNWIYEKKNRDEAISILEKNVDVLHPFAEKTYEYVIQKNRAVSPGCNLSLSELENLVNLLVKANLLKKDPSSAASKYVDLTFLEKAKIS